MLNRRGQNIAEYSILIALVIAAAVAMQVYVKRGIQGRVADAVDHAPNTDNVAGTPISFTTKQYEPYYAESEGMVTSDREVKEDLSARGGTTRTILGAEGEKTSRAKGAFEKSKWESTTAR